MRRLQDRAPDMSDHEVPVGFGLTEAEYDTLVAICGDIRRYADALHHDVQRRQDRYTVGQLTHIVALAAKAGAMLVPRTLQPERMAKRYLAG